MFSHMVSHGGAVYVAVYVPANSSGHFGFLRKLAERVGESTVRYPYNGFRDRPGSVLKLFCLWPHHS
jgi:hypothetical protein